MRKLVCASLACLALVPLSCDREPGARRPPNVLVIVVDTLRADRLGAYGNGRGLTPFLDGLAARGTVFAHAYAASSWTCPSVASLLTSRFPSQTHIVSFASRLADDEITFAEKLRPLRYLAGGFSANFRLLGSLGYAQGFDHWQAEMRKGGDLSGTELRAQALGWLDRVWNRSSPRPALLYLQYMEPHAPYDPPEPFRARYAPGADDEHRGTKLNDELVSLRWYLLTKDDVQLLQSLYDAEVAAVDAQLRQLFAELEWRGFLDDAFVVVTADHGEEFWDHGNLTHGITLYNESVRVPLLVLGPGVAKGRRVEENVSLVDLAPTLIDLLGLPREPRFEGRSLAGLLRGAGAPAAEGTEPEIVLQLEATGYGMDTREQVAGIVRGTTKVLLRSNGLTEAYDLAKDPGEHDSNAGDLPRQAARLVEDLQRRQAALLQSAGAKAERAPLDDATREKLRALGYHF